MTQCPQRHIGPDIVDFVRIADRCKEFKALPVEGGVLDQTQWFLDAYAFYRAEVASHQGPDLFPEDE